MAEIRSADGFLFPEREPSAKKISQLRFAALEIAGDALLLWK